MSVCGAVKVEAEFNEPWSFTRPDPRASGMFFFQNCRPYVIRQISSELVSLWIQCTYLDCTPHDRFTVLDNEAKVRDMTSEYQ